MTIEEIKIRRLTNQYLTHTGEKRTVIRELCGFQAQFMANALHSIKLRCSDFSPESAASGLVKNWTVRGTVHVFSEEDLPLFIHCHNGKIHLLDTWYGYYFERTNIYILTPERQKYFSHIILEALQNEPLTRDRLKEICWENGMTQHEESAMFDPWGGGIRELCERGFINYVVEEKKSFCLSPPFVPIPEEEANLEIARRYFTHFAPATIKDAMYYFHATKRQVINWLAALPVKSVECGGKNYYYIENGRTYRDPIPECLFLAGFDQLMLGYEKKENPFLPSEHLRGIFNLAGIVMPAILLHGRVVGKWKKVGGQLQIALFESIEENERRSVCNAAERLWSDLRKIKWKE